MPTLSNNLYYLFRGPFKMDSLKTLGIQNGPNPYQQFTNHDCLRSDKPTLSCRKETLRRFSPVCSDIFRFDRHTPTYCQHVIQIVSGMPHAVLWYAVRILRLVYPIYKAHEINEADHDVKIHIFRSLLSKQYATQGHIVHWFKVFFS